MRRKLTVGPLLVRMLFDDELAFSAVCNCDGKAGYRPFFHSISSSEYVENGKPDPSVYFSALNRLQVDANR